MTVNGVVDSLRVARKQVPDTLPAMAFVKIPESWELVRNDDAFLDFTEKVANQFFHGYGKYRGTEHFVSVAFYSNTLADTGETYSPLLLMSEYPNPRHRWGKSDDWRILQRIDMSSWPGSWIQLLKIC